MRSQVSYFHKLNSLFYSISVLKMICIASHNSDRADYTQRYLWSRYIQGAKRCAAGLGFPTVTASLEKFSFGL